MPQRVLHSRPDHSVMVGQSCCMMLMRTAERWPPARIRRIETLAKGCQQLCALQYFALEALLAGAATTRPQTLH